MINLRPHHLLCIKGFRGKGYSKEFVENMIELTSKIKNHEDILVNLRSVTDDICICCPNKIDDNLCESQEKITYLDINTLNALEIEEGVYSYKELNEKIKSKLNPKKFEVICKNCGWYSYGYCKDGIFR